MMHAPRVARRPGPGAIGPSSSRALRGAARARAGAAGAAETALALGTAALLALPLPVGSPARRATIPLLLVSGAVAFVRRSGWRAVLRAGLTAGAAGLALELVAIRAGTFAQRSPELLWWLVPLAWAAFVFPVLALVAARPAATRVGGAAAALVALALLWDPLGMHAGIFTWPGGGSFAPGVVGFDGSRGIPPGSFAAWAFVAACAALAAGRGSGPAVGGATPLIYPLLWLALAWRTLHAGIQGTLVPSLVAAALALLLLRVWARGPTLRLAPGEGPAPRRPV